MEQYKTTLMDEAAVLRALKRISHEILEHNNGAENICIIGIRRRGISLAHRITDYIETIEDTRVDVGELDITFYRDDLTRDSVNPVIHQANPGFPIEGRNVVLVDDVLYTGRTASAALDAIKSLGRAATIQLAVLIDRGHRELPIRGDYVGKSIPTSRNEVVRVRIPPYETEIKVELYEIK